jgi:DNA-binding response OmpR family regulator
MSRLFRPFQQLESAANRRYGGTGLGLTISRSFVELHHGRMWVESEPGRGAVFRFRLPIDSPGSQPETYLRWINPHAYREVRIQRSWGSAAEVKPRYLVLEREDVLSRLVSRCVPDAEVIAVGTLEAAVAELGRGPARVLVVNDSTLPAPDALDVRSLPDSTPIVLCALPGLAQAAASLGVADYLVKPVSGAALLAALDRLSWRAGTVLIVDDEPDALRLYRRYLVAADRGYGILRASDGQQALEALRDHRPDAVILDLVMPTMDGLAFLAAKSEDPLIRDIPVIVVSARDPVGEVVVSGGLTITRRGGISVHQILACVQAATAILSPVAQRAGPGRTAGRPE